MSESYKPTSSPLRPHPLILAIVGAMSIAQVVMGAKYQFDCPGQRYIPIYLLANGVVSLLLLAITNLRCGKACFGDQRQGWACYWSLFLFCWFIAGNVWIYSIYKPNYFNTATITDSPCDGTLYQFAFWNMNTYYILLGVYICSVCGKCCVLVGKAVNRLNDMET